MLPLTQDETIHHSSTTMLSTEELDVSRYGLKQLVHHLLANEKDVLTNFNFTENSSQGSNK